MPSNNEPWYNNKELFEMFQTLKDDVKDLSSELKTTRDIIIKYNGLREALDSLKSKVEAMENQTKGKTIFGTSLREWTGYILALVMFILSIIKG